MALVSKTFSQVITFTRASTATLVGSNGLIQSAAIDAPRFDYDPVTLAAKGLLIEESRANLYLSSEDFNNAYWNQTSIEGTITSDSTTSPDGLVTADLYQENTATSGRFIIRSIPFTSGTTYTASIFAKQAPGATRYVGLVLLAAAFGVNVTAVFTLSGAGSVTIVTAGTGTVASIEQCANGWYRCTLTSTATATSSANTQIRLTDSPSGIGGYTGDGSSGIYLWGAQLEAGAFPTSYIPTTTTSLTRSADSATVSTLSPWFSAAEGTLFSQANTFDGTTSNIAFYLSDGTTANRLQIGHGNGAARVFIGSGGATQVSQNPGTYVPNATSKVALGYATNNSNSAMNGTLATLDTACTIPSGINAMRIGGISTSNSVVNGWISRLTYYPRRLSDAELQTITT